MALHKNIIETYSNKNEDLKFDKDIEQFTNQLINKVNNCLESFNYNKIIASLMKLIIS